MKRSKAIEYFEQGDVLLIPCTIPADAQPRDGVTLAEGEATGHRHRAIGQHVSLFERKGVRYLRTLSDAQIEHEEHRTIYVPGRGTAADRKGYEVRIVREWDHFAEEARNVVD